MTFHSSFKTLTLTMEDPLNHITEYSHIPNTQSQFLNHCEFLLDDLPLEESVSASEGTPVDPILICSPPLESMEQEEECSEKLEEECYQTPEENLSIHDLDEQVELKIGGESSSAAVDLGRDTDLLFSDGNRIETEIVDEIKALRVESSENRVLIGDSSCWSRKPGFDLNNIPDDSVGVEEYKYEEMVDVHGNVHVDSVGAEEHRDEETENVHVFSGDVEMDISPLVHGSNMDGTHLLDTEAGEGAEIPESSQPVEGLKEMKNEMSNASDTIEVQDKFEINDSNGGNVNSVSGVLDGVRKLPDWIDEVVQRDEGRRGRIGGRENVLNSGRKLNEQRLTGVGSSSPGQEVAQEENLGHGGRGLGRGGRRRSRRRHFSSGREEQRLTGAGSSTEIPEMRQEANAPHADVSTVTRNCSTENTSQAFVKLSDLVAVDDNDILVVAMKAGMKFPRPRWWRPAGYGPATS